MTKQKSIRESFFVNGKSISEIARETAHDRKTIRKYLNIDDWNEPPPGPAKKKDTPKLEPYKELIDGWLMDDRRAKVKQRHTATRVYNRLSSEKVTGSTFNCSYRTVNTYVQNRKKEIFGEKLKGHIPLEHSPGEAQGDFGAADYSENGALYEGRHFNLSFPYSNQGFVQLFPGENVECLLEGLKNIFTHINGVPHEIWFDNASTMVSTILKGGERETTEKFMRFSEHYGFTPVFCNPDAGHEKGSVEGKVGYHRRNMLVPVPKFEILSEYNKYLLNLADADASRPHYKKEAAVGSLFEEDKAALLPLPNNEFDTASYITAKVDKYGFVKLNEGKHEYSTAPKYAGSSVSVKLTSTAVVILDGSGRAVAAHKRLYGKKKGRQMDWVPYLEQLARRPRAVKYTGMYNILPPVVQEYLAKSKGEGISDLIRAIADLTRKTGFESAVATVAQAASHNALDADSLLATHRRLFMGMPELPPIQHPGIPNLDPLMPDLAKYDLAIGRWN